MTGFWRWLLCGVPGGKSGLRQAFLDVKILLIHLPIAGSLAWFTVEHKTEIGEISDIAGSLMLPFAGVLVGLCFAWGGHATALMQTEEIEAVIQKRGIGVEDYVFGYQFAILTTLVAIVAWGLGSLGMFDMLKGRGDCVARGVLFFLASFSVNQCWSAAVFASAMLQVRYQVRHQARKGVAKKRRGEGEILESSDAAASPETSTA